MRMFVWSFGRIVCCTGIGETRLAVGFSRFAGGTAGSAL